MNTKIIEDFDACLKSLAKKFSDNPMNFFTESDIHAFLYYYIFRYGGKELKIPYPVDNGSHSTILIHREYPTCFRYRKETMTFDNTGGRGHYDLAILNPEFIKNHTMNEVIAKNFTHVCDCSCEHLLAAIEFKFIIGPLGQNMKKEIEDDIIKLSWALKEKHAINSYMIIFNRYRQEEAFVNKLKNLSESYGDKVKIIYKESFAKSNNHPYKWTNMDN